MKIVEKSLKDLKMYENNPRNNDEAVEQVANSIKEFGFKVPMVIDKENVIVCGHTRYKACIELGIDKVPCIVADDLSDEQIKAFRLAENRTNEIAEWDKEKLTNATNQEIKEIVKKYDYTKVINPIGEWTGGTNVDAGATNRKLGSDMARSVTGGGLHGKDLSKADVSVNIYAFLKAQETGQEVELSCAIGDSQIDGKPYEEIVEIARKYIKKAGGFEKFAEWGLF